MSAIDEIDTIAAFPARPLKLTGYDEPLGVLWGIFLFTIGCMFYIGLPLLLYRSAVYLVDDYRLQNTGVVAMYIHTDSYRSSAKSASFEFNLRYSTRDGRTFSKHVDFFPILYPPDRRDSLTVRYDPASPRHFSTSWGVQRLFSRTIMFVIECVVVLIAYRALISDLREIPANRRRKRALAAIAAQHVPIVATLVNSNVVDKYKGADIDYSWTDPSGQSKTARRRFKPDQEPFWLDPAKTKLLALISPDPSNTNIVLLNEELSWVSLTDEERAQLRAARNLASANHATQSLSTPPDLLTPPAPIASAPAKPAPSVTPPVPSPVPKEPQPVRTAPVPQTPPVKTTPQTEQMCDQSTRELVSRLTFAADPYLWGYHWGRPFDGGSAITQVEFGDDLLRIHFANSATSQEIVTVWSPRGISVKTIPGGIVRSGNLLIRDAQRIRWDWLYTDQSASSSYLEFWRWEGEIYGKSNSEWAPNTGTGLGDQSLPAFSISI